MKLKNKSIFIGIDPGSKVLGYALVQLEDSLSFIDSGAISLDGSFESKLLYIYTFLNDIYERYIDTNNLYLAIELPFLGKYPQAFYVLAQIRGVLLLSAKIYSIPILDFSPLEIKKAMTSFGFASKHSVQESLALFFNKHFETSDESDALAVALAAILRVSSLSNLI